MKITIIHKIILNMIKIMNFLSHFEFPITSSKDLALFMLLIWFCIKIKWSISCSSSITSPLNVVIYTITFLKSTYEPFENNYSGDSTNKNNTAAISRICLPIIASQNISYCFTFYH